MGVYEGRKLQPSVPSVGGGKDGEVPCGRIDTGALYNLHPNQCQIIQQQQHQSTNRHVDGSI